MNDSNRSGSQSPPYWGHHQGHGLDPDQRSVPFPDQPPAPLPNEQPSARALIPLTVGFMTRARAILTDGAFLTALAGVLYQVANAFPRWPAWGWIMGVINWMLDPAYYAWAYSRSGQTPGKKAAGIKVVSIDGSPLDWRKGLLRTLGYLLSAFPLCLGFLWSIWDHDKQTWHDKLAGTYVVEASVQEERVRWAYEQTAARRRPDHWKWAAAASTVLMLGIVSCAILLAISIRNGIRDSVPLHDDEWTQLEQALSVRVNPDDNIPSFSTNRSFNKQSGKPLEVWLEMEMTYTPDCEPDSADWCYHLANELVQIVFDNYPHIDEIHGIHVVMTKSVSAGPLELNWTPVDDALTIQQWRERLGLQDEG